MLGGPYRKMNSPFEVPSKKVLRNMAEESARTFIAFSLLNGNRHAQDFLT